MLGGAHGSVAAGSGGSGATFTVPLTTTVSAGVDCALAKMSPRGEHIVTFSGAWPRLASTANAALDQSQGHYRLE